jgi:hypothetical protein
MKRTTIMLPAKLKAQAERRARRQGISLGQLIRVSLERSLNGGGERSAAVDDSLLNDNVTFHDGGPRDLARNHDRYLYGEESDFH